MTQLRHDSELYETRGLKRLGVVIQKRNRLAAHLERHPMPFPMLADEKRAVAMTYGVYVALSFESFRIARPSTFLIGTDGLLRFIHVGVHQFDRPGTRDVLKAADAPPADR